MNGTETMVVTGEFAVHLGVARGSNVIILEQTGKNSGYSDKDVCGFCPESQCCIEGGPEKLRAVCKEFKQARTDVIYSRDAGRYLCDFAYYCSLYHGQRRAALIHVPSSFSLTPTDRLAPLLHSLIQTMLEQLEDPSHTAPRDDDSEVKNYNKERSRYINKTPCH